MSLTIGEASAVNRLLDFFIGGHSRAPWHSDRTISVEEAGKAAEMLARSAHKALMAGWTEEQVAQAWPIK